MSSSSSGGGGGGGRIGSGSGSGSGSESGSGSSDGSGSGSGNSGSGGSSSSRSKLSAFHSSLPSALSLPTVSTAQLSVFLSALKLSSQNVSEEPKQGPSAAAQQHDARHSHTSLGLSNRPRRVQTQQRDVVANVCRPALAILVLLRGLFVQDNCDGIGTWQREKLTTSLRKN